MKVHIDYRAFQNKPSGADIGGIKSRFINPDSIKDMSAEQIAEALCNGQTIQPGVTPFSEASRAKGAKGTCKEDFSEQTMFMNDIDNKNPDFPLETPAHVVEVLKAHHIPVAFAYDTFNSTNEKERFRFAVICDETITDDSERERIQGALIRCFPQSDSDCINADRIFFGTDKGLCAGIGDITAVCKKTDLLAFADAFKAEKPKAEKPKFGEPIPTGKRHSTLVSFANTALKKYGISEQAVELFFQRVDQCEEPMPESEVQKIWDDACRYYANEVASDPNYIEPLDYAAMEFSDDLEPYDYTDVGEARVFASQYHEKARFSNATNWLVYDGMKWNENDLQARALVHELTDRQLKEARTLLKQARAVQDAAVEAEDENAKKEAQEDIDHAKNYRGFVLGVRKSGRIAATLTEAKPALEINVQELDANPFYLNTPGGIVDLRTLKMKKNEPSDYCTKITAVAPSRKNADLWLAFLDRITCGDKDLQEYHQIVAGMALVGKVYTENLIIAYGSGGNGKSTFYNAMFAVLGDYAGSLSAEALTVNCRKNKSPEFAELRGKRFVIAAELEEGNRLDTSIVKHLSSTDPIKAEKKFKDPFEFLPSHTTILYTNHLPKVGTNDPGTWDRLVVVPFAARFRGMKGEIKNYADYLFQNCGGAILLWMMQGAKKFIDSDFIIKQPESVKEAVEAYRQENDWMNNFLSECCEIDSSYSERAGALFDAYKQHCAELNEYVRHVSDFKAAITAAGYSWKKTKNGAYYYGLRLKSEFAPLVP